MDTAKDELILRATQEILAEVGYELLTIEAVAARAKASKNTIYRRWPSKPRLVMAAILGFRPASPLPDSGSLRDDVRAAVHRFGGLDEFAVDVMLSLVGARRHHPDLAQVIDTEFAQWARDEVRAVFERAAARRELDHEQVPTLALVLAALTFHRQAAVQVPADDEFADFVTDRIILPLVAALHAPARAQPAEAPVAPLQPVDDAPLAPARPKSRRPDPRGLSRRSAAGRQPAERGETAG
jgi:AcrR family transcriptional regulator